MSHKWRIGLGIAVAVLALVGSALRWHITVVENNISTVKSPLHPPMNAEKCYELAAIKPTLSQLVSGFNLSDDGSHIFPVEVDGNDEPRYCTLTYNDDGSLRNISLDLPVP